MSCTSNNAKVKHIIPVFITLFLAQKYIVVITFVMFVIYGVNQDEKNNKNVIIVQPSKNIWPSSVLGTIMQYNTERKKNNQPYVCYMYMHRDSVCGINDSHRMQPHSTIYALNYVKSQSTFYLSIYIKHLALRHGKNRNQNWNVDIFSSVENQEWFSYLFL